MSDLEFLSQIKSKKQILIDMYNKKLQKLCENAVKDGNVDFLSTDNETINNLIIPELMKKSTKSKQQIIWLTITKSNSCEIPDFIKLLHTLPKYRLTADKPKYCFESTGIDAGGGFTNIHCHYLCMKQVGINKQNYIRRLEKILKDKVFNINIQIYTSDYYDDKVAYMNGQKDSDQYDKPEITKQFRDLYKVLLDQGGAAKV